MQNAGLLTAVLPGTAYVDSVRVTEEGVTARLVYPAHRSVLVKFDCVFTDEDRRLPSGLDTLLAVHVRSTGSTLECSALGTSFGGPHWVPVSLAQALALAQDGAHTVLSAERHSAA
jgi:hypothetical protein